MMVFLISERRNIRWLYFQAHIESHVILKFGSSPDMSIAVDWDIKHQHKQTNKQTSNVVT